MAGRVCFAISLNIISLMSVVSESRIKICESVCLNTSMCAPSEHEVFAFTCRMKSNYTMGRHRDIDNLIPSAEYQATVMELKCVTMERQPIHWCSFERCILTATQENVSSTFGVTLWEVKHASGFTYNCTHSKIKSAHKDVMEQKRRTIADEGKALNSESGGENGQDSDTDIEITAKQKRQPSGYKRVEAGEETIHIKKYKMLKTGYGALNYCQEEGARLVQITTMERNTAVLDILKVGRETVWVGLRDVHGNNTFFWCDGSPLTYTNWYPGEPTYSHDEEDEDCVIADKYHWKFGWYDEFCNKLKHRFVCEIAEMTV